LRWLSPSDMSPPVHCGSAFGHGELCGVGQDLCLNGTLSQDRERTMELFDAVERRASVRSFNAVVIPEQDLMKILDAGRRAPSGSNHQPYEFILIREQQTIEALGRVQSCIASASAAIAIICDPAASRWWIEDAAAAAENMLLAIEALGYASVWVEGTLLREEDFAKELLGVPDDRRFLILLPIGKPVQPAAQATKRPLQEMLWRERYGQR